MKKNLKEKSKKIVSLILASAMVLLPVVSVDAQERTASTAVINEINSSPDDWVEIMNTGNTQLDLSGYEIRDNSDDHRWGFPAGSTVEAGELFLVEATTIGEIYDDESETYVSGKFEDAIGIGSGDSIRLYNTEKALIDEYSWTSHASYNGDAAAASVGRYPDGTGAFVLMPETKGTANSWYKPQIVINEIESNGDTTDWIEIYNAGSSAVDISGWYVIDDDPVGHAAETTPLPQGTILSPGENLVFDQNTNFTFGLGKADKATLINKDKVVIDEYAWTAHATGVYARISDGTGEFTDFATSTKGEANVVLNPVKLNEMQSNDPEGGSDWIELANPTSEALDISGIVIKDSDDAHEYTIPAGTTIAANGFLVITEDTLGFGLGKNDSVRLFENGLMIENTTWSEHTNPTWGLYPNVNGNEYRSTKEATKGTANVFDGIPDVTEWAGNTEVNVFDTTATFLEDSSGLDFYNGQLYAIDNGTGTFWIMDVAGNGAISMAPGFENGKRIRYQKDADNQAAAGPDTEGITVDENGNVYAASERDNSNKGVNYNSILMVNPNEEGNVLVAKHEWDLTASLPAVSANMGIEAVEYVNVSEIAGKLVDKNTNQLFDMTNYSDTIVNGIFFVALEDNGHVYAYVLNNDNTSVQIADIDSKIGGAMALDYDSYEHVLWVAADDGYGNMKEKITLNGTSEPNIVHVKPAAGLMADKNNEGFAIASAEYTVNGQRPVFYFEDGVTAAALKFGSISCDYIAPIENNPETTEDESEIVTDIPEEKESEIVTDMADEDESIDTETEDEQLEEEKISEVPETGDTAQTGMYVILLAACGIIGISKIRIKE